MQLVERYHNYFTLEIWSSNYKKTTFDTHMNRMSGWLAGWRINEPDWLTSFISIHEFSGEGGTGGGQESSLTPNHQNLEHDLDLLVVVDREDNFVMTPD